MASENIARLPAARKDLLVRTAAEQFASVGYERASLNRIIRACGLSKSSFYHFISSKQELFDLVVREYTQELADSARIPTPADFAGPGFWSQAEGLLARLTQVTAVDAGLNRLGRMYYLIDAPAGTQSALAQLTASVELWLNEVLAVGRASDAVRDDVPISLQGRLVFAVLRALDEWTLRHSDDFERDELVSLVRAEYDCLRRLLQPDA